MFWGLEVGNKPVTFTPPFDAHLTAACLTAAAKGAERNVLVVKYDGKEYSLCSLKLGLLESSQVDLIFEENKEIVFQVLGGGQPIHLSGYFVSSMDHAEEEEDDEFDDDEEIEMDDSEEEEEIEVPQPQSLKRKSDAADKLAAIPVKKAKETPVPAKPEAAPAKQQTPTKPAAAAASPAKSASPAVVKHPNGLIVKDIVVGNGMPTIKGKTVSVKYVGKLTNGKTFDSSIQKPFNFKLGVGEVIKGWDQGVHGMRVGGKRQLTIPAHLAYGSQGSPPQIPGNATLVFEVELVKAQQ
ncbi:hypothetical protein SAMD00019534_045520 [Acytostelium subglobosum LB1]|uniref:hypothetical protein n=1 Tax=Acytostelium subglobosum LB1 TaxID=1410327 RepID=UPI00064521E2|nr:hypothetical protein SAMD00019534_045520 [Acytostelium subglobosum LB1]GAM21377.1 hypothetical protein SAMD00019534_045520 [Acytostelium subglobosum LB1]|eukprot:XP_012755496.1 hypothetical protein SAMD00019534_045520 [Acytostelium subglobosum LB1]